MVLFSLVASTILISPLLDLVQGVRSVSSCRLLLVACYSVVLSPERQTQDSRTKDNRDFKQHILTHSPSLPSKHKSHSYLSMSLQIFYVEISAGPVT